MQETASLTATYGKTSITTLEQIVSIQIRCSLSTEQTQIKRKNKTQNIIAISA